MIGEDGAQLGVMTIDAAIIAAENRALDLIEVAPTGKPPVCKIMDYGKYKYQEARKKALAKKKQVVVQIKEVKLRPKTERHDLEFKTRHIRRFLGDGDKAKVVMVYKGREIEHPEIGRDLMKQIIENVSDIGQIEASPRFDGKALIMVLSPIPEVLKKQRAMRQAAKAAAQVEKKE